MTTIFENNEDIRVEHCSASRREIQDILDDCREERRPYIVLTDKMLSNTPSRILVPVTMLEEEVYKSEICTYIARKTGAHIILLRANDYGSKAKTNTQKIIAHIQTIAERTGLPLSYEERTAKGDSFSMHKELHRYCEQLSNQQETIDLIILTASREYGLDDWLFGPPEQFVIRHSQVPVMLVNPRADLFSLCD